MSVADTMNSLHFSWPLYTKDWVFDSEVCGTIKSKGRKKTWVSSQLYPQLTENTASPFLFKQEKKKEKKKEKKRSLSKTCSLLKTQEENSYLN